MSKVINESTREVCSSRGQNSELPDLLLAWIASIEAGSISPDDEKAGVDYAKRLIDKTIPNND
jgi:hypothetical protein